MQNDLQEFHALLDFCIPGCLGEKKDFNKAFANPIARQRELGATCAASCASCAPRPHTLHSSSTLHPRHHPIFTPRHPHTAPHPQVRGGSFELRSRDASLAAVKNHVSLAFMRLVDHSGTVDRGETERCQPVEEEEEEKEEEEEEEEEDCMVKQWGYSGGETCCGE